jgi:hypothetical protein
MSDGLDDLLGDNNDSGSGDGQAKGGGLRAQLEAALAREKALSAKFEQIQAAQRQRDLDGLFEKHKIPALAKDFFPADAELDDKAVTSFVEKYGQLWGAQPPGAVTSPADQAATAAMQQASAQGTAVPLNPLTQDEYKAKFDEAKSMADLRQMMSELGAMQV